MTRILQTSAAIVVALVALGVAGRIEANHAVESQNDGIARVRRLVGPRWATSASAYRLLPYFDCLLYQVGKNRYALELCFDWDGRVIEGIDRRSKSTKFWTLRYEPKASHERVSLPKLIAAFRAIDAAGAPLWTRESIPIGFVDLGPLPPLTYVHYNGPH